MKLKRDLLSTNAPSSDQIEVGELAINAKTGVLYSKMVDGTVIKFIGTAVCDNVNNNSSPVPVPDITFSDVTNFCCGGDSLTVYVSNLLVNHRYICIINDLLNSSSTTLAPLSSLLLPLNKSDRSTAFNISINKKIQSMAMIKVTIYEIVSVNNIDTNMLRSEKVINVYCNTCES